MIKKYFMVVAICLSFIIPQQGFAADFTIQINPSPNSVGDQEVSEISASKISGFASLVFSTISSTLSNYLLKSEIKSPTMQEFKTAGSFVYYLPQNPRPLYIKVKMIGGGGSGQGSGTTTPPNGTAGNLSSFGTNLLIATGGGAGVAGGNLGGHCTINGPANGSCFIGGLGQGITQTPFSGSQFHGGQGGSSCVGGNGGGGSGRIIVEEFYQ